MTDPLGQSQVLAYLSELTKRGHEFHLISFEKKENSSQIPIVSQLLKQYPIHWHPLTYHKSPPVFSTLYDLWLMFRETKKIISKSKIDFIHSRSYLPSLVALAMKKRKKIPFIFDMRGFWADERVEGNLWPLTNPLFKLIYRYIKRKEKKLLFKSDAVVSLTENARQWMIQQWNYSEKNAPIKVIPCCCDTNLFALMNDEAKSIIRSELQIPNDAFVLGYVGSIGTWYMLDEMLQFFKCLQQLRPDAWFLFITRHEHELIRKKAAENNLRNLKIVAAERNKMPALINTLDASVYFIKPSFSKKASSPVKQAELMSAGIPSVTNSGIGDTDLFFEDGVAGIVIQNFDKQNYMNAATMLVNRKFSPMLIRQVALKHFNLQHGVELYDQVYAYLTGRINDGSSRHASC